MARVYASGHMILTNVILKEWGEAAETLRFTQGDKLLFHRLEFQPIDIFAVLHTDRFPAGFHLHANF